MRKTTRSEAELNAAFAPLYPSFTVEEATAQASRCLFCYDAPCTRACPTAIDVPRFIRQILHGNDTGAAETILEANALGDTCARVCPTEVLCEGACVDRPLQGAPVPIGRLQRFAMENGAPSFEAAADSGRSVAIVGGGPAGLSCAWELRRLGHAVTVHEAGRVAGGLGALGIALYKVSTDEVEAEVERIRAAGVTIHLESPVGPSEFTELRQTHDALFLGVGLGDTFSPGIAGEDGDGVFEALGFIRSLHEAPWTEAVVGSRVLVLGGGNTAIDAAINAAKLGAESVTLVYRRDEASMPAYAHEVGHARAAGVEFEWMTMPLEFLRGSGGLRCLRAQRLAMDGDGRAAKLTPIDGAEFELECDMTLLAMGQEPLTDFFRSIDGLAMEGNRLVADPDTCATALSGVFAGGDCVNGGAELVHAVAEGKRAAFGIHAHLGGGS